MIEFMLQTPNLPFSVALAILLIIALIEGVGLLVGFALSAVLENLVPSIDLDVEAPDMGDPGAFGELLTWLRVREVPVIFVMLAFLTSFSITGFVLQQLFQNVFGFLLPAVVAAAIATVLSLPGVRLFAGVLGRFMPRDETEAIERSSFIGRRAVVTLGVATHGSPAQGRFKDRFGQSHYVMIEPDVETERFEAGDEVLLVSQSGATFQAIRAEGGRAI